MCTAWHGPKPFEGAEVRHLDGSKNNRLSNLRWGTFEQNMADRELHGKNFRGEKSPRANHTQEYIDKLRVEYNAIKAEREAMGKIRIPRGWLHEKVKETGIPYGTLVTILVTKRGYHPK